MAKTVIKVSINLKVRGVVGLFCLLLGVSGVHHVRPYVSSLSKI